MLCAQFLLSDGNCKCVERKVSYDTFQLARLNLAVLLP